MTDKFKPVPNVPKTYEQVVLEEQSLTNQQDLYPDLEYGDISEQKGYGPCSYSGCSYSERFYLKIGFKQTRLWNWHFKDFSGVINGGKKFDWLVCTDIQVARNYLEKFERGTYEVVGATGDWDTSSARNKKSEVVSKIRECIHSHERGCKVEEEEFDFTDSSGMPSRWEDGREVYQGTNAFDW